MTSRTAPEMLANSPMHKQQTVVRFGRNVMGAAPQAARKLSSTRETNSRTAAASELSCGNTMTKNGVFSMGALLGLVGVVVARISRAAGLMEVKHAG